jgi:RNA polymerase sigma-70 factor, ECF subfamily
MGKAMRRGPAVELDRHDDALAAFRPPDGTSRSGTLNLEGLCREGTSPVFRELLRLTGGDRQRAEDLTQETFVRALRQHGSGDGPSDQPELTVGWLIVVARRLFIDQIRRQRREARAMDRLRFVRPRPFEPDWHAINSVEALRLLAALDDEARAAIVLRYVHDLPVADIAKLLDRSVRATESTLVRARQRLARVAGSNT